MQRIIRHPSLAALLPSSIFRRWRGYTPLEADTEPESLEMSARESGSYDEKADVKDAGAAVTVAELSSHHVAFTNDQVDTAAQLVAGEDIELDPAEAARIRKKIDWHILPMMCSTLPYDRMSPSRLSVLR